MKKKKLSLDREVIKKLSESQLVRAGGGLSITGSAAPTYTCTPTCPTTNIYTNCNCPSTIDPSGVGC